MAIALDLRRSLNPKCWSISRFQAWQRSRSLQQKAPCLNCHSAIVSKCKGKVGLIGGAIARNDQQTRRNNQFFIKNSDNLPTCILFVTVARKGLDPRLLVKARRDQYPLVVEVGDLLRTDALLLHIPTQKLGGVGGFIEQ